jgi:hypothetical protein
VLSARENLTLSNSIKQPVVFEDLKERRHTMASRNRMSKRTALAAIVGLATISSGVFAEVKVVGWAWETRALPFSKKAGIVNNKIVLGPADADSEIKAPEGHMFVRLTLQFAELSADERSDLASGAALADAAQGKHDAVALFYDGVWRPIAFLRLFTVIRVPETAEVLFSIPRDVKLPLALSLGTEYTHELEERLGPMPAPPKPQPARTMYCIFDGIKLREDPSSSADGDRELHAGQKVTKTRQRRGIFYVTTDDAAGWIHPAALVDSRAAAERIASYDPKPNALFVATGFTSPSDFQLQIWHGELQLPHGRLEGKLKIKPGNCIVVSQRAGGSYTGPYQPFGHAIVPEHVGRPLIFDRTGSLAVMEAGEAEEAEEAEGTGGTSAILMLAMGAGVAVVLGLAFVVRSRRRRLREAS